ncbi:hypothetical protein ACIBKY_32660 [Nonomuraea sp. NPDC050394]|uniref:hypothetical protein n=1 Tax=Nonomuraea sp. NPDC050394 TaxID=3364363 RepID=UPI0037B7FF64
MVTGSSLKRGLLKVLGIAMAPIAALVLVGAQPASAATVAAQACTGQVQQNVCVTITSLGFGFYEVRLGIDFRIGLAGAQQIINAPGEPFSGALFGADSSPEFLLSVPVTSVGASEESGLSADFVTTVPRLWLDEDLNDRDEMFGKIRLLDSRFNVMRTFDTPQIQQFF